MNSIEYSVPSNVVKVAFSGSHGVGKTTLVSAVKGALHLGPDNIVEEVATRVFEAGKNDPSLVINQGATLEAQMTIIGEQLLEENNKVHGLSNPINPSLLLCDRSSFDAVVYTNRRFERVGKGDKYQWGKSLIKHLFNWVCETLTTPYDVIFYQPISFALESSEIRPGDVDFQEEIDSMMQELLFHSKLGELSLSNNTLIYQLMNAQKDGKPLFPSKSAMIKEIVVLSGTPERRATIALKKIADLMSKKETLLSQMDAQNKAAERLLSRGTMPGIAGNVYPGLGN